MILADKILMLRKQNNWSQEELAEKLGVSRQSVSKWESAASIPDLNRILELATVFGVTTDYLLKDNQEDLEYTTETPEEKGRLITLEDTEIYLSVWRQSARKIATGVLLIILGVIPLIIMTSLAEYNGTFGGMVEDQAGAVGCIILFMAVVAAVGLFVYSGMAMGKWDFLEKENFELAYGVKGIVEERQKYYEKTYIYGHIFGISLCIIAVVPLFIGEAFAVSEAVEAQLVGAMLALISVGVFVLVEIHLINSSFNKLLLKENISSQKKWEDKRMERISTIYWCVVTAGYLLWSFLTMDWDKTWIVWPVAGVLWAAVRAFFIKDTDDQG